MNIPSELRELVWKYCTIDDIIHILEAAKIAKKLIIRTIDQLLKNTKFHDENLVNEEGRYCIQYNNWNKLENPELSCCLDGWWIHTSLHKNYINIHFECPTTYYMVCGYDRFGHRYYIPSRIIKIYN